MEQDIKPKNKPTQLWSNNIGKRRQDYTMFERQFLQQMVLRKLDSYMKKMKSDPSLAPNTKISSKWITDHNVRPDTIKLLEENKGRTLSDINCSNIFIDSSPRNGNKNKNKLDPLKPKNFFIAKKTINKMKRQITDWENKICK